MSSEKLRGLGCWSRAGASFSNAKGCRFNPGQGARTPRVSQPKKTKREYCGKIRGDFRKWFIATTTEILKSKNKKKFKKLKTQKPVL